MQTAAVGRKTAEDRPTLPGVTIHYAQTLDGRIATRTGQSQWVSGEESLCLAHRLRADHDAVMVGVGTVLADNPRLTVRRIVGRSPRRVVVDSTLRLPLDCHVLADGAARTVIITTPRAAPERRRAVEARGATVVVVGPDAEGRVDLVAALRRLAEQGIGSVLLEGGSALVTSALRAGLVNRLVVCIAPKILGAGIDAIGDLDVVHLSRALTFQRSRFYPLGADVIFEGEVARSSHPGPEDVLTTRAPVSGTDERAGRKNHQGSAKAVWFPRARAVELREEDLPPVGPADLRVRAQASGISHGTETLVYRGQVSPDLGLDLPTLRGSFAFPIKYGYASVGRVTEVGAEVDGFEVDDAVFVLHPHQTEYIVPATLATRLPPDLDPSLGVFLANLETAINVTLDAHPRLGERVVVFGQGVVGLLVTQLLRRAGVSRVVAVDPLERRRELALAVGADVALAPDDVPSRVRALTDGVGADLAIEVSGNAAALQAAIDSVAFQGTVVVASWYGTKSANLSLGGAFHRGRVRLVSSQVSHLDPALEPRWTFARRLALARDLLANLTLAPLITHRFPFERAADAYALVDEHPDQVVGVILEY